MLDRVAMAAATIPRGDERMRPSTDGSAIGRPDCCRPPCAAHTANALLATAGLLGQTIIVPTMAENAVLQRRARPVVRAPLFRRATVGGAHGRFGATVLDCFGSLEAWIVDLLYLRSEPHARAALVLPSVLCGEVAEWLKAAVLKTARR